MEPHLAPHHGDATAKKPSGHGLLRHGGPSWQENSKEKRDLREPPLGGRRLILRLYGVLGSSQTLVMSGLLIQGEKVHCLTREDQK